MIQFQDLFGKARETQEYEVFGHVVTITEAWCARMKAVGMTRAQLAEKLKVSPAYISKLFTGQNLTIWTMVKISRALDLKLKISTRPSEKTVVRPDGGAGDGLLSSKPAPSILERPRMK